MHGLYRETNQTHHGLMLSWSKPWEGHWVFFNGLVFSGAELRQLTQSLDNIRLAILHLFFHHAGVSVLTLNIRNGSKCLGSLLKVQLASVPQVIPLEGFPTSQEHPIKNSKTTRRQPFPHKPIVQRFVPLKLWRKKTQCPERSAD